MAKRLEQLLAKRDQLQARIRAMENRQKARDRRLLTRKKILLGSLLQEWMKSDEELCRRVDKAMQTFLTRAVDREAFGLQGAKPSEASPSSGSSAA